MVIVMDMGKWQEYLQKQKELHVKFRNRKIIIILIWLLSATIISFVWAIFKEKLGSQLLFMGILFSNAILIFVFFRKIAEQKRFEKQQEALLREEEPVGRFKM